MSTSNPTTLSGFDGSASTKGAPPSASPPHLSSNGGWDHPVAAGKRTSTITSAHRITRQMIRSALAAAFEFFKRLRPVFAQQTGECSIGQQPAFRLTGCAVVGFVRRVNNPLHRAAADWTRLAESSMHCHSVMECRDFCRKLVTGFLL